MTNEELERLAKAAEGSRELDRAIWHELEFDSRGEPTLCPVYTTSLDAALALAERLHPCWSWSVGQNVHHKYWRAYALALDTDRAAFQPIEATAKTPALALCLAILKANHKDKP